jgi:hypothetical protein
VDWTQLAWNREWWWVLVNTVINLRAAWKVWNFFTSWMTISFSTRTLLHGVSYFFFC